MDSNLENSRMRAVRVLGCRRLTAQLVVQARLICFTIVMIVAALGASNASIVVCDAETQEYDIHLR